MSFHTEKLLKTLEFWKSLNSLYDPGSRAQKSPQIPQKTLHSIAIRSIFWIDMLYKRMYLVNLRFRICMAKGDREALRPSYGRPKLTLFEKEKTPYAVFELKIRTQFSELSQIIESVVFWYIWKTADSRAKGWILIPNREMHYLIFFFKFRLWDRKDYLCQRM